MITAQDIYDFQKCPHRVYLNRHGDASKKRPLAQFLDLLFRRGHTHEKAILARYQVERPKGISVEERRDSTMELMKRGAPLIYQGVIETPIGSGIPDLLRKADYESSFGKHAYEPIDIKSGSGYESKESDAIKGDYGLQMAFYSLLLEGVQGVYPKNAYIINIDGEEISFNPMDFRAALEEQLPEIRSLATGTKTEEPAKCGSCPVCAWQDHCLERLRSVSDVTLVVGIGKSMKKDLIAAGVKSVKDVMALETSSMKIRGIAATRATKFSRQARSYLENKMLKLPGSGMESAPYRVYFDFEDDPLQALVYLYGFVLVEPDGTSKYRMIWCDSKAEEKRAFEDFYTLCSEIAGKDYKVYHFASHERTVLRKLMELYPLRDFTALNEFMGKMIDLNREVTSRVVLPTLGYGLKEVSKHIGFQYTDEDPGGAQSIAWFQDYQRDPTVNAGLKERILAYNRDDCEATKAVHEWLIKLG